MTRGYRDEGGYSPRSIIVPKNGNSMLRSWTRSVSRIPPGLKVRAFRRDLDKEKKKKGRSGMSRMSKNEKWSGDYKEE